MPASDAGTPSPAPPKKKRRESNKPRCGVILTGRAARGTGRTCRNFAGQGTDHSGVGRCWLHGGATPITHGLYSTVVREQHRALVEALLVDRDKLESFDEELAHVKVLIHEFAEGCPQGDAGNREVMLVQLYGELSKLMERREKVRESRIWQQVLTWLVSYNERVMHVLSGVVTSPETLREVGRKITALLPGGPSGLPVPSRR